MKKLSVKKLNNQIDSISIDGTKLRRDDADDTFIVTRDIFRGASLADLPPKIEFNVYEGIKKKELQVGEIMYSIAQIDQNHARISFTSDHVSKYWTGSIGLQLYMETVKDIVLKLKKTLPGIAAENEFEQNDGEFMRYVFSREVEGKTTDDVIRLADETVKRILSPIGDIEAQLDDLVKDTISNL